MKKYMAGLAAITQKLTQIGLIISAAGLVLMVVVIFWQVFARYLLNASLAWSESTALLLMLYYIMLASAVGVYEGFHLGLSILLNAVSKKVKRGLILFNNALIAIFGVTMLLNGTRLALFTADHIIPTLNISRAVAYWPFAAAGFLICLFAVEHILIEIFSEGD